MNKSLILAAGLMLAASAHAEGYVAVAGGPSKFAVDCAGTSKCDTTGTAFKLYGGYQFGGGLAAEAVYFNFGKTTATVSGLNAEIKATAAGAGGAFALPLSPNSNMVLRLGLASVKMTVGVAGFGSQSYSKVKPYVGIGATWSFSPNVYLEGAFDSTQGEIDGDSGTVRAFTVGVGMRF